VELNFLIPNTELLTGKRLQPYYDRADRPRIDAWQTVANGRLGLHDPNDGKPTRAGHAVVLTTGAAGSRQSDYAGFNGVSLIRGY
jgi:hypothetical protein